MATVFYFPNETSGKFDPDAGFRHEFGEGGSLPKRDWSDAYPDWERVDARAFEIVGPHRYGFVVKPEGIVG